MKELVVISGKGGTGKTSLMAAFASLAENKVLCDADVDAADLHLILDPEV
ncbi:MAG: (4Fe-4S)-binding protein, partial [Deltaproteobacteria bacterium]|nr:(4Fe-4S)-binding protein [Deltaproteobacteria bacterium]